MTEERTGTPAKISRYALVIVLLAAFSGVATYAVMSDSSIHGLAVRFYDVTRSCPTNSTGTKIVTFTFGSVVVYSSNSLPTSLSGVSFAMSADGVQVGTATGPDSSFSAGQSASYGLSFSNPALDPRSLPSSSQIVLGINAKVSAGLFSSQASASDSQLVQFGTQAC